MSTTRRRAVGALAAILLLAASLAYSGWRLHVIGQEGWAGLSYIPATPQAKKAEVPQFLRFRSGSIIMLYPDSPAECAGLRRGDRIVAIGGVPLTNGDEITKIGQGVRHGQTLVYRVEREGGGQRDIPVRFGSPIDSTVFLALFSVTCLVAFVYLIIGLFVFWRRPRDPRAVIFFAMTLCAASTFVKASLIQVEGVTSRGFAMAPPSFGEIARPLVLPAP